MPVELKNERDGVRTDGVKTGVLGSFGTDRVRRMKHPRSTKILLPILLCLIVPAGAAAVVDHLEPDVSSLAEARPDEYRRVLDEKFVLAGDPRFVVRALSLPSWGQESVAGIRCVGSRPEAFAIVAAENVHFAGQNAGEDGWSEEAASAVEVSAYNRPIDSETAALMYLAWGEVLLETRYRDDAVVTLDGTRTLFSAVLAGRGHMSGQTHSPGSSTLPGALVKLADLLKGYARGEEVHQSELAGLAREIVSRERLVSGVDVQHLRHACLSEVLDAEARPGAME